jgi:lactate dehydrogenase-like 2-hydroxyacid dehydrogenase
MSDKPLVMISHPMLVGIERSLQAAGLETAHAWELAEADKPRVRAMVFAGDLALTPEYLTSLPNLGLIANVAVGYDRVDVPWCRAHGIEVTHAKGLNADDVADHAMGLLIGAWRNIVQGDRMLRAGRWRREDRIAPHPGLGGKTLGVVGLGAIGEAVAVRAEACRMNIIWWGPNPKESRWPRAESLLALAQASDVLMVATRADPSNRGLISKEVIEAVGPHGLIVNVARGSVIDEDALVAALRDGRLGRAALDVFAEEPTPAERWADLEQVVVTPHTAGGTTESIPRMVGQAIENVQRFMAGEALVSPV